MKIRILNKNEHCFVRRTEDGLIHGGCSAEDCCMSKDYELFLCSADHPCLRESVKDGESFFFELSRFENRKLSTVARYYGNFTENLLNIEEYIDGVDEDGEIGAVYLVSGFVPAQVYPRKKEFDSFIQTADHLLSLNENEFIGLKDGEIQNLSPSEALACLSEGFVEKLPLANQIRIAETRGRPVLAEEGCIIFNSINKKLEIFTGGLWKSFKFEE
jgi:hypothetical protein